MNNDFRNKYPQIAAGTKVRQLHYDCEKLLYLDVSAIEYRTIISRLIFGKFEKKLSCWRESSSTSLWMSSFELYRSSANNFRRLYRCTEMRTISFCVVYSVRRISELQILLEKIMFRSSDYVYT